MSYTPPNLSVLAYANNFTLWHYTTTDTATQIAAAGYFNGAGDMLRVNDLMILNIDTDGTPSTKFYVVTANSGGAVTVAVYA